MTHPAPDSNGRPESPAILSFPTTTTVDYLHDQRELDDKQRELDDKQRELVILQLALDEERSKTIGDLVQAEQARTRKTTMLALLFVPVTFVLYLAAAILVSLLRDAVVNSTHSETLFGSYGVLGGLLVYSPWSYLLLAAALSFLLLATTGMLITKDEWHKISSNQQKLRDYAEKIQDIGSNDADLRITTLRKELRSITNEAARAFLDNPKRYAKAKQWREEAQRLLDQCKRGAAPVSVNTYLSEVESSIASIRELILQECSDKRIQRWWQALVVGIVIVYIVVICFPVFNVGVWSEPFAMIPVFQIPYAVIMWGAAGSLAAILYRFYNKEKQQIDFNIELRWLIARPITGIIMSAVVVLAIVSGRVIMGAAPPQLDPDSPTFFYEFAIYGVIAFLAGFSDKFFNGIINLLVERTGSSSAPAAPAQSGDAVDPNPP